jgi:hypothetical protein
MKQRLLAWVSGREERKGLRPRDAAILIVVVWLLAIVVFGIAEHLVEPKTFPTVWLGMWWSLVTVTTRPTAARRDRRERGTSRGVQPVRIAETGGDVSRGGTHGSDSAAFLLGMDVSRLAFGGIVRIDAVDAEQLLAKLDKGHSLTRTRIGNLLSLMSHADDSSRICNLL